jgi:hypothetical protein
MKPAVSTYSFSAWVCVETKHKQRLEFVLSDADDRNGNPRHCAHVLTTYVDRLMDMIRKEFERSKSIRLTETSEYGDVMFCLQADTPKQLQSAIVRSERVTRRWINKYHVNDMKESQ